MSSPAPKYLGAFITLLLATVLSFCTGQNVYYVKTSPDTPCHEEPCHTLSEYVSEAEQYFTSNTTMVFLPGEHALQENVTVSNVGGLALTGNPSSSPADRSRIICTDVTFTFTNTTILEIVDFDFHSCTIQLDTSSAVFKNSSFENSTSEYGGAIYAHRSTIVFLGQAKFKGNKAAVFGGGIFAEESNLTFHGNTTFINNEAKRGGGGISMGHSGVRFVGNASFRANFIVWELDLSQFGGGGIYGYNSSLDFDLESMVTFSDNSAANGGGILANGSTVNFSGVNHFINNTAEYGGGGVYVRTYSNMSFGDYSKFTDNSAQLGGGIDVWQSFVSFGDGSTFINNSGGEGGGVFVEGGIMSFGDGSEFIDNSAKWDGGGVHVQMKGTVSFGDNSRLINNTAELGGGGVFVWDSNVSFGNDNTFTDTLAQLGGGIYVDQYSTVSLAKNCSFISTSAEYGGGVYVKTFSNVSFGNDNKFIDASAQLGGGIYADRYSTVSLAKNCSFVSTSAVYNGGGIYVKTFSNVSFGNDNRFIDASALLGGGIYVDQYSTVSLAKNCSFISTSAEYGGGVYVKTFSNVSFGDDNTFTDTLAQLGGGIYVDQYSTVSLAKNCSFINTSAGYGGGVYVSKYSNVIFGDDNKFISTMAVSGGGVYVEQHSNVIFSVDCKFINNTVVLGGGGVHVTTYSNVCFGDDSSFIYNSAVYGGGVHVDWKSTGSFGDSSRFVGNFAKIGGGGISVWDGHIVSFGNNSTFIGNSAQEGGGIHVKWSSTVILGDDSRFIDNSVLFFGGAIFAWESNVSLGDNSEFRNNSGGDGGGGLSVWYSNVSLGDSIFTENSANYFGGCMAAKGSTVDSGGSSDFINNLARYGGCIFVDICNLTFSGASKFYENSAIISYLNSGGSKNVYDAWYGGAILTSSSNLTFGESLELTNNSAGYGGAVYLTYDSIIYLLPATTVSFEGNFAQHRGGAVFVDDNPYTYCIIDSVVQESVRSACFLQTHFFEAGCTPAQESESDNLQQHQSTELQFYGNSAKEAGSIIYGGNLDSCGVCTSRIQYVPWEAVWDNIPSNLMSSDPYHVCSCVDNYPHCHQNNITREIFPGETFVVPVVAFGRYNGTVPAIIQTYISQGIILGALQGTQKSNNTCTNLQYSVRPTRDINVWSEATLALYADEPCSTLGIPLAVFLTFLPCPLGFSLSTEGSCECDQRLNKYNIECDINDQSIFRKDNIWIGFDEQSDNHSQGLILHPHCPFGYCKPGADSVHMTMNNTDLQCNHKRSGHLCGACQHDFSLAVGSSRCLPCSNIYLTLLIPFALAGLALVIFLFICKVTIAAGTISGLIFYANVVTVNQSVFLPSGETNILTVFIAWLNLDFGIETCFFDGMDAYSMTWLQFVFPIYIWLLVGLITILCNVSTTAARILGSANPIAILATLFLLSYTKLLRTIIATFSFTILEYPYDETKVVWLYDGNIGFLDKNDGRHIVLFLASLLVFLFLFLPYTLFLLFGQCILPRLDLNKLRWLSWTNYLRMKSFLDAHHAPYKDRHRYWIGLLLVLRFLVFLISAIVDIESPQDPHVNLLVIITCNVGLAIFAWIASGGVYKKWHLNVLESSFIFNLIFLSAATYQVKLAGGNQAAVFYSSVSVAFATFIGIIIYHVYKGLRGSRIWRNLVRKHNERRTERDHGRQMENAAADEEMEEMLPQAPTVTYFEIPTNERRKMHPITPPPSPTNVSEPPDHLPREEVEEVEVTPYTPVAIGITPPLPLINFTELHEPLDHFKMDNAAVDKEAEKLPPQVTPSVTYTPIAKVSTPPPPSMNFTDLREPLDLLTGNQPLY